MNTRGWFGGAVAALLLVGATPALAAPGDRDPGWGSGGLAALPGFVATVDADTLPSGRTYVVGKRGDGSYAVAKLLANGTPDLAFDGHEASPDGLITLDLGFPVTPVAIGAAPSGSAFVVADFRLGDQDQVALFQLQDGQPATSAFEPSDWYPLEPSAPAGTPPSKPVDAIGIDVAVDPSGRAVYVLQAFDVRDAADPGPTVFNPNDGVRWGVTKLVPDPNVTDSDGWTWAESYGGDPFLLEPYTGAKLINTTPTAIAAADDGSIAVTGRRLEETTIRAFVERRAGDGTRLTAFGGGGSATVVVDGHDPLPAAVGITTAGGVQLAGAARTGPPGGPPSGRRVPFVARLTPSGALDSAWSGGDATPGYDLAGIDATGDASWSDLDLGPCDQVWVAGTADAVPGLRPARARLSRYTRTGLPDAGFAPASSPPSTVTESLGAGGGADSDGVDVSYLGGTRSTLAGTGSGTAAVARYGGADPEACGVPDPGPPPAPAPNALPVPQITQGPVAFGKPRRPGTAYAFGAEQSTDPDGDALSFTWRVTENGVVTRSVSGATLSHAFSGPGDHLVTLVAQDARGAVAETAVTVKVVANVEPVARFLGITMTLDGQKTELPFLPVAAQGDPMTFRLDASDPDGTVARIEYDLDGDGGYEQRYDKPGTFVGPSDGPFRQTRTFPKQGSVPVRVRVTDDEGGVSLLQTTVTVLRPGCRKDDQLAYGRMRITGPCLRTAAETAGGVTTETTTVDAGLPVAINGLVLTLGQPLKVLATRKGGAVQSVRVTAAKAAVRAEVRGGVPISLLDGKVDWTVSGDRINGFTPGPKASFNDLPITGMLEAPRLLDKGQAEFKPVVKLPADFGGATTSGEKPPVFVSGDGTTAKAAQAAPYCFEVPDGITFGIGLDKLVVCYLSPGDWSIQAAASLTVPFPIGLEGDLGIVDGGFGYARAKASFGGKGLELIPPYVYLQAISAEVFASKKATQQQKPSCVPKVGRELVKGFSYEGKQFTPDFYVDHGFPSFALCGGIDFTIGPGLADGKTLGRGNITLGIANYDDRDDVFRILGNARILDLATIDALFELYSDGYVYFRVRGSIVMPDIVRITGGVTFEAKFPKFNAHAFVEACVLVIDIGCIGAQVLASSKGAIGCVDIITSMGVGFTWKGSFTPYLMGCEDDIYLYRERIPGAGNKKYFTLDGQQIGTRSTARSGPRARAAQVGDTVTFDVPAGRRSFVVAPRGTADRHGRFELLGPAGERYVIEPELNTTGRPQIIDGKVGVARSLRDGVTNVVVGNPTAGRWTLKVLDGSPPLESVAFAAAQAAPVIKAQVSGTGADRVLRYDLGAQQPGTIVRFYEEGESADGFVGATSRRRGVLRFRSDGGRAERRSVYAVLERGGMAVQRVRVARFRSAGSARAGAVRGLRVRRSGTGVRVSWNRVAAGGAYEVTARVSDGRVLPVTTRRTAVSFPRVARTRTVRVTVRAVTAGGRAGPRTGAVLRAAPLRRTPGRRARSTSG